MTDESINPVKEKVGKVFLNNLDNTIKGVRKDYEWDFRILNLFFNGETRTPIEISELTGLTVDTVCHRLQMLNQFLVAEGTSRFRKAWKYQLREEWK